MSNTTNIEQVQGALVAFDRVSTGLALLRKLYEGVVYDVRTTDGLESAREARRALREPRYEVERIRKDAKKPLLELGKQLDSEAKRITDAILEIEDPIDAQIRGEEQRREAERQAKIEAERKRVEGIRRRIDEIRGMASAAFALNPSASIALRIAELSQVAIDDSFAEFRDEAQRVHGEALDELRKMLGVAEHREAEAARIAAERAELERLRAEQAERDRAERQRLEEERAELERIRRQQEEREREAREQAAAAERAAHAELERQRAKQEARLRADREAFEAERAAARAAAEAELAAARAAEEAARQPEPEPPTPAAPAIPAPERPSAATIIALVADTFITDHATAEAWLRELFGTKARRKAA